MLNSLSFLNSQALSALDFGSRNQMPMNQLVSPQALLGFLLSSGDGGMALAAMLSGWSWPQQNGEMGALRNYNSGHMQAFADSARMNATPTLVPGQKARGETFISRSQDGTFGAIQITPEAQRLMSARGMSIDRFQGALVSQSGRHVHSLLDRPGVPNRDVTVSVNDGQLVMRAIDFNGIARGSNIPNLG